MSEALSVYTGGEGGDLMLARPPEQVVEDAARAAKVLKDIVTKTGASIKLGQSEHLKAEAWQTLGHFYGLAARIRETRLLDFGGIRGYEAFAELYHVASGRLVSTGEGMCTSDEERWDERPVYQWVDGQRVQTGAEQVPLFQLRSMAQTRAISKAHSNCLRWVVTLAGYAGTPAEEMTGRERSADGQQPVQQPQRTSGAPAAGPAAGEQGTITNVMVDGVKSKSGTSKSGRAWTLYLIAAGGKEFSSFDQNHARQAEEARDGGATVDVIYKVNERGKLEVVTIAMSHGAPEEPQS